MSTEIKASAQTVTQETVMRETVSVKRSGLFVGMRNALTHWFIGETTVLATRTSNELAEIRTDLAETRTLMAADRTLMAWFRTALSMYSFGFTIYKLLQGFQQAGGMLPQGQTPRNIGLFLTGMGTLAMVMGTIEYWQTFKDLRKLQNLSLMRPSFLMAIIMSIMGTVLFFGIITKLF